MLEIIAQILCAMLLLGGLGFVVQALNRPTVNAAGLIASLIVTAFSIVAAIYFYNAVDDQASGARKALGDIERQLEAPIEPASPY